MSDQPRKRAANELPVTLHYAPARRADSMPRTSCKTRHSSDATPLGIMAAIELLISRS